MGTKDTTVPAGQEAGFEEILRKLQGIVERLESGDLALEESISAFEHGVQLSRRGQAILDAAERRVDLLLQNGGTSPFDAGDAGNGPG